MIRRHEFNTEWWGDEVGIAADPAFFHLAPSEQQHSLMKFAWVEFVSSASRLPRRHVLARSGFFCTDTQLPFRLDLTRIDVAHCAESLHLQSASEVPFEIQASELRPFRHERFSVLPEATEAKISERYALWSAKLLRNHPQTCLSLSVDREVQGWFLSQPEDGGLNLALAMLSARATVSGADFYRCALSHFAKAGFRLGFASFSARNSNVLNIYAHLGARFMEPRECWMWVRD